MSEPNLDFVPDDTDFTDKVEIKIPPTAEADYQAYLTVANGPDKPFGDNILPFEEFVIINYMEDLSKSEKLNKLGYVIPMGITPANIAQAINTVGDIVSAGQEMAGTINTTREQLNRLNERVRGGNRTVDVSGNQTPPPGGGGGGSMRRSSNEDPGHYASALSLAPSPLKAKLDTGIPNLLYGPLGNGPEGLNSPLHLTGYHLNLAPPDGPFLDDYYSSSITLTFQIFAQEVANFNLNTTTVFSYTRIHGYMSALTNSLSVFYFFASVLGYADNRKMNDNEGMSNLRSMMTAEDFNEFWLLRDVLENLPIPPNLNHLVFYLNQTFSQSELPNSPLLKLLPLSFVSSIDPINKFTDIDFAAKLKNCRTLLTTDSIRETGGFLNKVCPGWKLDELMSPINIPIYDTEFLTLWRNLPHSGNYSGGAAHKYPLIGTYTEEIPFFTSDNDIDGAVIGMLTTYYTPLTKFTPVIGCIKVSTYGTTRYTNRISYQMLSDGTKAFAPAANSSSVASSRGEVCFISAVEYKYQPFGTELAKGVSFNVISQAGANLLKWLMTFDTFGSGVSELRKRVVPKIRHTNDAGKRNDNPGRRPRKSRDKNK